MLLDKNRFLHLAIDMGLTRSERMKLRFALGKCFCTNEAFLEERDRVYGLIATVSPLALDVDEISVWAGYDETLAWMLSVPHIAAVLPDKDGWLVVILTNDGTPQHGRLSNRQCHSMLMRLNLTSRDARHRQEYVGVVGLWEIGESTETFMSMFRDNAEFYDSFNRMLTARHGYANRMTIIVCDGVGRQPRPPPRMPALCALTFLVRWRDIAVCHIRACGRLRWGIILGTAAMLRPTAAVFAPCQRHTSTNVHGWRQTRCSSS